MECIIGVVCVAGVECRIPSFWKRVSAELIDFTILFYIKLVVTVVFMREMGFMSVAACEIQKYKI